MTGMLKKAVSLVLIASLVLSTTGCWDMVDINERAFVFVMCLDKFNYSDIEKKKEEEKQIEQRALKKGEEPPEEKSKIDDPNLSSRNRLVLTIGFPNEALVAGKPGLASEQKRFAISAVGRNMLDISKDLSTRIEREVFYGHLKEVIIGEQLAEDRDLFLDVIGELAESHEISRNIYFGIVEGKAKDAIFVEPLTDPLAGRFIEKVFQRTGETARFIPKKLGDVIKCFHENGSCLVPRIVPGEDELKIAGSCVIKDAKLVGYLGEKETRTAQLIDNMVKGAAITVETNGELISIEITQAGREYNITTDDRGNILLNMKFEVESYITGSKFKYKPDVLDDKFIKDVEKAVERKLTKQASEVMGKMQHQFGTDIWQFSEYVRKFHPDLWEQVKDNWDKVFADMKVNFDADIKIRRVGVTQ